MDKNIFCCFYPLIFFIDWSVWKTIPGISFRYSQENFLDVNPILFGF